MSRTYVRAGTPLLAGSSTPDERIYIDLKHAAAAGGAVDSVSDPINGIVPDARTQQQLPPISVLAALRSQAAACHADLPAPPSKRTLRISAGLLLLAAAAVACYLYAPLFREWRWDQLNDRVAFALPNERIEAMFAEGMRALPIPPQPKPAVLLPRPDSPYKPAQALPSANEPRPNARADGPTAAPPLSPAAAAMFAPGGFAFQRELPPVLPAEAVAMPAWAAGVDPFSAESVLLHTAYHPVAAAKRKMLVVIPFRDLRSAASNGGGRTDNLREIIPLLTQHLSRFGKHIGNDFAFLIVEQDEELAFNKGMLMNIGFVLARAWGYDYLALHDVDYAPISPQNTYDPPAFPTHLAASNSDHGYEYNRWEHAANGAVLATLEQYKRVNGFSNLYWGWGMEDVDFYVRMQRYPGGARRLNHTAGVYRTLQHPVYVVAM